jgi:YebC/PmpR family DNA-binding regulatory protein
MSGHSKWSKIRHKKQLEDQKRGKIFSKLAKEIRVAVKEGGSGDPEKNLKLRSIIERAREEDMPKDNIERAIDKALGKGEEGALEKIIYEGYAPGGVGLVIRTLTDNKNRTVSEVRSLLNQYDGSLAESGSVLWQFKKLGQIKIELSEALDYETVFTTALEDESVIDVVNEDAYVEIYCKWKGLAAVSNFIQAELKLDKVDSQLIYKADNEVKANDPEKLSNLVGELLDSEDVMNVWTNAKNM